MDKSTLHTILSIPLCLSPLPLFAGTDFSGPNSVNNTLKANKTESQQTWRETLAAKHKITLGLDYQMIGLKGTGTLPETDDSAASGVFRFYGAWELVSDESGNTGELVWKVEHRHSYTDIPPKGLGFLGDGSFNGGLGYAGVIAPAYSDQGSRLTNLYWKQKFNQGNTALMVGFLDTTDYLDSYALASPWTGFTNLVFSTGSAATGLPDDGILGVAVGHMLNDNFYLIAGLADAKGDSSNPFEGVETLFNDHKLFTSLEIGWTKSQDNIYTDNVHVTAWQLDGNTQNTSLSNPDISRGLSFSASYFITSQIMPFIRGGFSDGPAALYTKSMTIGLGYFGLLADNNTLGLAVNAGEVNEDSGAFGQSNFDTQYTSELYFNIALSKRIHLTPNLQYIKNPALNSYSDSNWVFGLRARMAL
ncbi:carbohydrate porin [Shewanella gelidimarina]|uniref:carbohydrate porin n=1 Tax=Shewanella gelidimarina TaxID=56813 RepID=UPI00200C614B|nr:carbohydrate porin [Shewanella gelidimarina]MCL1058883.1 carbohydrate porin [Shewanella gelidimarina]